MKLIAVQQTVYFFPHKIHFSSKACLDSVKTGYNTMKLKYDSGTKKINDLTNQYEALYKKSEKMMGLKSRKYTER